MSLVSKFWEIGKQYRPRRDAIGVRSQKVSLKMGRHEGLVVEHRTPEREVEGSILTKVAVLYHLRLSSLTPMHRILTDRLHTYLDLNSNGSPY